MANTTPNPTPGPKRGLTREMEVAGKQAEKLRQRAETLKKFAQRYSDSSNEQSHYSVKHQQNDPK